MAFRRYYETDKHRIELGNLVDGVIGRRSHGRSIRRARREIDPVSPQVWAPAWNRSPLSFPDETKGANGKEGELEAASAVKMER